MERRTQRTPFPLGNDRGQSWVETVIMLPALLTIFLGLFYLKDMVDMSMRAGEAARYVSWEMLWNVREAQPNRSPRSNADLVNELRAMGLGRGLMEVEVNSRSISQYTGAVSGAEPAIYLPQALGNLFGDASDDGSGFISGIASGAGGAANAILDIGAEFAIPGHEFFAYATNWQGESDRAIHTVRVRYGFAYSGMFASIGPAYIDEYSSLLTHPLNIRRVKKSDGGNEKELGRLIGDKDKLCDTDAHIFPLWFFPTPEFPGNNPLSSGLSAVTSVLSVIKMIPCGAGGILESVDKIFGGSAGYRMPDGTLKEYPELHL